MTIFSALCGWSGRSLKSLTCAPHEIQVISKLWSTWGADFDPPPPQPQNSLLRTSVCNQVSHGNSYKGEPGRGKNCSHCNFQDFHSLSKENQVSLARTFLSEPGSGSEINWVEGFGDKFGESLGGGQAPPSFWKVPGLPRKFPKLPRKFFGKFPGGSRTMELNSNPGVPRKFPRLPGEFPGLPRKFFGKFPGGQPLSLGSLTPSPDPQRFSLRVGGWKIDPDHGLRPWSQTPSEHCKPYAWRTFCVWRALFWIWSRRPRAEGARVDPCLLYGTADVLRARSSQVMKIGQIGQK